MEFEGGIHDGACKGRLHSHVSFIGRKTLTVRQKSYDDIHTYCRARVVTRKLNHYLALCRNTPIRDPSPALLGL